MWGLLSWLGSAVQALGRRLGRGVLASGLVSEELMDEVEALARGEVRADMTEEQWLKCPL
jgi:hypothetical protein